MYRIGHASGWKKAKHRPSGIFIVWLGKDNRPHSKSIGIKTQCPALVKKFIEIDTQTEILLKQLDHYAGEIRSAPMVVSGMTRQLAKQALLKELTPSSYPMLTSQTPTP